MSIKTTITSALVAVMAAGSLLPMASAASARDFDRHGGGKGHYGKQFNAPGKYNQAHRGWRGRGNHYAYGGYRHRHRDHSGRNLAIGAAAAILGIAIASEVARDRDHRY